MLTNCRNASAIHATTTLTGSTAAASPTGKGLNCLSKSSGYMSHSQNTQVKDNQVALLIIWLSHLSAGFHQECMNCIADQVSPISSCTVEVTTPHVTSTGTFPRLIMGHWWQNTVFTSFVWQKRSYGNAATFRLPVLGVFIKASRYPKMVIGI